MKEKRQGLKKISRLTQAMILVLMLFSMSVIADTPMPIIPKAVKGDQCVEDTDFMRKNHMELLLHQRDDTVQRGIRTKKYSLNECLVCHAVKGENNQPVKVADPRHFCAQCHNYAAVKVDCFQCHASTPAAEMTPVAGITPVAEIKSSSPGMKITDIKNMSQ